MNRYTKVAIGLSLVAYLCQSSVILAADGVAPISIKPKESSISRMAWITAYASTPDETSDHPFITASGNHVRDGIIAANFLPFGTKIEIPTLFGSKVFTVEDRMNERYSKRVDIWMRTRGQAIYFGIHHVKIAVLAPHITLAEK